MLSNPAYPYNANWLFFTYLKQMTNVSFNPTVIPFADYTTKIAALVNGGPGAADHPEDYPGQEDQFVAGGAILPVSDYVHLMPNFQDKVAKWNLARRPGHAAAGRRQVLPAAWPAAERVAGLHDGRPHRHPRQAQHPHPGHAGRSVRSMLTGAEARLPGTTTRSPTGGTSPPPAALPQDLSATRTAPPPAGATRLPTRAPTGTQRRQAVRVRRLDAPVQADGHLR